MKTRLFAAFLLILAAPAAAQTQGTPIRWETGDGGNGHYYEYIDTQVLFWDAQAWAESQRWLGLPGYLASLTSAEENAFVMTMVPTDTPTMYGLYQLPGSVEPDGGWVWISGETFLWSNWSPGEPNNFEDTECLGVTGTCDTGHQWNDVPYSAAAFVVEYGDTGVATAGCTWGIVKSLFR